jgi:hypothetical protein
MVIPLKIQKLLDHVQKKGFHAELQAETEQIVILLKIGERECPLFMRIYEGGELLQLLAFLPCKVETGTLGDTARLLHHLNKELDIPGFGMDETASVVFYRCMIPAQNKQVDGALLDAFLNSIHIVCKSFAPIITAVAHGGAAFEEVLKKAREQSSGKSLSQSQLRSE